MFKYILGALVLLILILLYRTIRFRPVEEREVEEFHVELDEKKIIDNFRQMIRLKTVSYKDTSKEDEGEFSKFRELLIEKYPNVNKNCKLEYIGRTGVLYHWQGKNSEKSVVFMAHYDVVPADAKEWEKEPFSAIVEDSFIWGRGTLDTKGTLCGIMEAADRLIADGFKPENDIYLSFAGDEETNGESAKSIVAYLDERGVKPFMVLDEGGAIVQGAVPGVKEKCALIGTGEKGKMHLKLSIKTQGGHGSAPPPITSIGRLARAVKKIEEKPFSFHISEPARGMFDKAGRYSSFGLRIVFANLSFFKHLLDLVTRKIGGEFNALFRTTVAFTKMQGSSSINVFPTYASVEADLRIMEGDTEESIIRGIKERINDEDIMVESLSTIEVKPFSNTDTESWDKLDQAIRQIWPGTIVSPYLMLACSDSRSYTKISDNVYRFAAMELSSDERKLIHGNNERIPVDKLLTTVKFYICMMQKF